jgi:uncharacterized Zn ribbon protein
MENKLPLYRIKINPEDETGVYAVSLVDEPAIEVDWIKLSKIVEIEFSANKDKQLLYGPLLIPNKYIYRRDETGYEYNIMFDKETIDLIADKFNKNKLGDIFNFQHSDKSVSAYLKENWLIENPDKSSNYGFDLPDGTWFGAVKVEDGEFWMSEVKTDKVKGFSVEIKAGVELIEMNKNTSIEDKNKNINLMEIKTNEGVSLFYDGEIGEGTILYTNEEMTELAPEGAHMLEDGRVVTLDANGSILSIATETPEIEDESGDMAEPVAQDNTAIIEAIKPLFEEFRTIIADLSSRIDALENVETTEEESTETEDLSKVVAELTEKVETLSKMAGGESITKKNDSYKVEKSGLMLSKINELRNRKNK